MGHVVVSGVRETSNQLSISEIDGGAAGMPVTGSVSRSLPADLSAVRQARDLVQQVLASWQADEIFDDVVLVASELVANALRHGLHIDRRPWAPRDRIQLSLVSTGSHVICAVTDPSPEPPVRQCADPLAGSGRGLQLVESLSLFWGWTLLDGDPHPDPALLSGLPGSTAVRGKSVWAIFPLKLNPYRQARAVGAA